VTPEAACFLFKARELLLRAQEMLEDWPDEAGRACYLAAFHAAQALIFENTGRVAGPHAEVQAQFGRLVRKDPTCDAGLGLFLGRTYNLKVITDYEADPGAGIAPEYAALAVERSGQLIEFVARSLMA
jgi:uncharacterized protein (UPF0332 family)